VAGPPAIPNIADCPRQRSIYGLGGYSVKDFLRIGLALDLILAMFNPSFLAPLKGDGREVERNSMNDAKNFLLTASASQCELVWFTAAPFPAREAFWSRFACKFSTIAATASVLYCADLRKNGM